MLCFVLCFASVKQISAQETLRIVLDGDTKLQITSPDRQSLRKLKYLDINPLVRGAINELEKNGTDSTGKPKEYRIKDLEDPNNSDDDDRVIRIDLRNRKVYANYEHPDSTFKKRKWRSRNVWDVDLGLANFMENGKFPDSQNKRYGLSTIGSYYAGVASNQLFEFYNSPIKLKIGIELSIYSLRLQNNNYITRNTARDSVMFRDYSIDFQQNLRSSRLTNLYFNIPIALRLGVLKYKREHYIAFDFGGYVGYRLSTYAGIKRSNNNSRERTTDSFLMNNWRYGLEFAARFSDFRIFSRYDLSNVFAAPNAPKLNLWTIGVRI